MAQVTKEEVDFIKESNKLIEKVLQFLQNAKSYEITVRFDEENTLPLISIRKDS